MLCISSANYLPCLLILHKRSGPRSVSDLFMDFLNGLTKDLFLMGLHLTPFENVYYFSDPNLEVTLD